MAVGLEVMVTINIETEFDVANDARGVIQKFIFDPQERLDPTLQKIKLEYPPLCVLVKLNQTKARRLPGLEVGVVLIVSMEKKYLVNKRMNQQRRLLDNNFP
jgi:hypothetical protein